MTDNKEINITLRLTRKEYEALKVRSREFEETVSELIRKAIRPLIMIGLDAKGEVVFYRGAKQPVDVSRDTVKGQMKLSLGRVGRPKKKVEEIEKQKAEA